jgi:hypothetical protein
MFDKDNVLTFIKSKGPVIPRDVVKEFGGDTFIAGAILSQLVDAKQAKVTNTKIGGTPAYYISGQEQKLMDLSKYLGHVEKKAYELLREKQVLKDSDQEPAIRIALRSIKDYAKQLDVNIHGQSEIFWKWFLLSGIEAEKLIKEKIRGEIIHAEPKEDFPKPIPELPKPVVIQENITTLFVEKEKELVHEPTKPLIKVVKEIKEAKETKAQTIDGDSFYNRISKYFAKNNIEILEEGLVSKNKEFDFIVRIPSPVGVLTYYAKAKNKKRINDTDLSSAYVKGEFKKLPVLFISLGEPTKKAKEMLSQEFKNITFKTI